MLLFNLAQSTPICWWWNGLFLSIIDFYLLLLPQRLLIDAEYGSIGSIFITVYTQYYELRDIFHPPDIFLDYGIRCRARKNLSRTFFVDWVSRSRLLVIYGLLGNVREHTDLRQSPGEISLRATCSLAENSERESARIWERRGEKIALAGEVTRRIVVAANHHHPRRRPARVYSWCPCRSEDQWRIR